MSAFIGLGSKSKELERLTALKRERRLSFAAILAQSLNGVIGKGGTLPWHEPADLKFFMKITMGAWMLMGRRTWESFENKALPGRQSIVISHNPKLCLAPGVFLAASIEQAIQLIPEKESVFVIGGSEVYRSCFPLLDKIWLTLIKVLCEGDVYFNAFSLIKAGKWKIIGDRVLSPRAELFEMRACS